jgi:hypothetical protein
VGDLEIETAMVIPTFNGYQGQIREYIDFEKGVNPLFGFKGVGSIYETYFWTEGFYRNEKDQLYTLDLDFKRIIKAKFDYKNFRHWTEHDPMVLPYASADRDPAANYIQTNGLINSFISYTPPTFSNLNVFLVIVSKIAMGIDNHYPFWTGSF